jgi:hypothetical protein
MNRRIGFKSSVPGLVATGFLVFVGSLQSDSYRCGSKLVRTGDHSGTVLKICGVPRHKDRGREVVKVEGRQKEVSVERWYYQKSANSLERIVLIHRGKVVAIETGGR